MDAGAARVAGVDVRAMDTEVSMAQLAVVFQDVYLFDATIEEIVRLGRPDAGEAEVRAAVAAARLDEVVERLPDGWDTHMGDGGACRGGRHAAFRELQASPCERPSVL